MMEKTPYPSELQERFLVRFPDGMRDRIADSAKANGRSMNAEIVSRIERSFATENLGLKGDTLDVLGFMSSVMLLSLGEHSESKELAQAKESAMAIARQLAERFYLSKTGPNMIGAEKPTKGKK